MLSHAERQIADMKAKGWTVTHNSNMGYVAVENGTFGYDFFFQGDDYVNLIEEVKSSSMYRSGVITEDVIMFLAGSW